jgi:hypothetical protein
LGLSGFAEDRISLYLGGVAEKIAADAVPADESINIGALEREIDVCERAKHVYPDGIGQRYGCYYRQAQLYFAMSAPFAQCRILAKDNDQRIQVPTIIKSRAVCDRGDHGVVLPLNWMRHWSSVGNLAANDRPFEQKDDRLLWRGVTTGCFDATDQNNPLSARYYLAHLPELADGIDAKFTKLTQHTDTNRSFPLAAAQARMGARLTMAEQLGSKFLLCLEGNDVATGLKWMLGSQSTIIMPKPRCETWLLEGELKAWEHYVPVNTDLSDLNGIYDWCRSNPQKCKEIAQNGRAYVARFLDIKTEFAIIRAVVRGYLNHADAPLTFSARQRITQLPQVHALWADYGRFKWRIRANKRGFGPG